MKRDYKELMKLLKGEIRQSNNRRSRRVLVTGGAGYIGSVLVRKLLKQGYFVRVLDNLTYGDIGIRELYDNDNFEFIKGNVLNIEDLVRAFDDGIDTCIHLAGIVGEPSSILKPEKTVETNFFSTRILLDLSKMLNIKFIYASTCSVYGRNKRTCSEETRINPLSLYALTKAMSEKIIIESKTKDFTPIILRFATVYGYSPRMRFDLVVNLFIAKAIQDGIITVYGDGLQHRPFIHVNDLADAISIVIKKYNKINSPILNVGSDDQNFTIDTIADIIKENIPNVKKTYIKEREDDRDYIVSFKKIKSLGFKAKKTINDAVFEILEKFKSGIISDYKLRIYNNYRYISYL